MIQAVTFKVRPATLRRLQKGFESMPRKMLQEFGQAFEDWGEDWRGSMLDRFRGGDGLHTRTGGLKRSLDARVTGKGSPGMKLRLVSGGVPYARIQEHGGTVKPINARFLAIPLDANKTAAGVPRYPSPRAFIAAHPGETFFLRAGGTLLLMWKNPTKAAAKSSGTGAGAVPLWMFVRQVTIPPRLGFFKTWKQLRYERDARMVKIARAMGRFS